MSDRVNYAGLWDVGTFYPTGTVVATDADNLFQTLHDSTGEDPDDGAIPWIDVTGVPLDLTAEAAFDPTADDGIAAAIGSTLIVTDTAYYVKTDDTATDWTIVTSA